MPGADAITTCRMKLPFAVIWQIYGRAVLAGGQNGYPRPIQPGAGWEYLHFQVSAFAMVALRIVKPDTSEDLGLPPESF